MGQKKVVVLLLDKIEAEGFKGGDFLLICDILLETQWMFFYCFLRWF